MPNYLFWGKSITATEAKGTVINFFVDSFVDILKLNFHKVTNLAILNDFLHKIENIYYLHQSTEIVKVFVSSCYFKF